MQRNVGMRWWYLAILVGTPLLIALVVYLTEVVAPVPEPAQATVLGVALFTLWLCLGVGRTARWWGGHLRIDGSGIRLGGSASRDRATRSRDRRPPADRFGKSLVSERSLIYHSGVSPRANALPPTERRIAIVRSALGLIRERGTIPTTREIAEAAGIAEGTIFRAFDTKERLMDAVVGETFCPAPVSIQLHAIDDDQPLRPKLVAFVAVLQDRFTEIFDVMSALGLSAPPAGFEEHRGCSPATGHVPLEEQDLGVGSTWDPERRRLVGFLDRDADRFSCTPEELLRYLRLLTFSGSHPDISEGRPLTPEAIVDLVLDGVLVTRTHTARTKKAS